MASYKQELKPLVELLNNHLLCHGISFIDFITIFTNSNYSKRKDIEISIFKETAEKVIQQQEVPNNIKYFKKLIIFSNDTFNLELPLKYFNSVWDKILNIVKTLFAGLLFIFISYIVLGGIIEGDANLFSNGSIVLSFLALIILILTLAAFEGLQISVTTLRLKDLSLLKEKYPRAYLLHKKFKSVNGTNRFLAGRQLFVIIVVFFAARLTSFTSMQQFPFSSTEFPLFLKPWFTTLFLELGVAGALFVLWSGQLAPQFIANKHPHGFLNLPGMSFVLNLSFIVESLELTRPGNWLSKWTPQGEFIPTSPEEKFCLDVENIRGFGRLNLRKSWVISKDKATLDYDSSIIFKRSGINWIKDPGLLLSSDAINAKFNYDVINLNNHEAFIYKEISNKRVKPVKYSENWRCYIQEVTPKFGPFIVDDVLFNNAELHFKSITMDRIDITDPTKCILFRAKFSGEISNISNTHVRAYKKDDSVSDEIVILDQALDIIYDEEGTPSVEFNYFYPPEDSYFLFYWEVEY